MLKKIALAALLAGLIGILVTGAVIRTIDKTGNTAEAREQGKGNERNAAEGGTDEHDCDSEGTEERLGGQGQGSGQGQDGGQGQGGGQDQGGGQGQSGGQGQGTANAERQYPNYESAPEGWTTLEGTVIQSQAGGEELVITTAEGQEAQIGTGPGYMEAQGFALQAGEEVQVMGYWEDGELKAAQVTRMRDGQSITLRDEYGRPAWAGAGKRAAGEQAALPESGQGSQDSGGSGQAEAGVEAWLALEGTVTSVDSSALVVQTVEGDEIVVEGRPWSFAQQLKFWANESDVVTLLGFYEGDEFEVGQIDDQTTGETVVIREVGGRPLWAGGGRRGG